MLPKYLFYITTFLIVLGQFSVLGKGNDTKFYLADLFVLITACISIAYFLISKTLVIPKKFYFFLLFSFWAGLTLFRVIPVFRQSELAVSFLYLIRFSSYIVYGLSIFNLIRTGKLSKKEVIDVIIISGVLVAVFGFIQLVVLPDFEVLDASLGWDPHKNRLSSTFFDPNFVGSYLSICIALIFDQLFEYKTRKFNWYHVAFVILFVALLLTFSRSSWLMFAVIVFVFGIIKSKTLLFLSILIGFSAYFAVPRVQTRLAGATDPADSAHYRLISWSNTYSIIKDNPVFGVGFNTFRYVQKDYGFLEAGTSGGNSGAGSDSSLMFITATTGVVGLCIFLFSVYYSLKSKSVVMLAVTLSLFLHSLFVNSLFYSQIVYLWMLLLAIDEPQTPLLT